MILSMTGFSALDAPINNGLLTLELRAVNSRYLDVHFKLDDALKTLEPLMRTLISASISRGKVECKLALAVNSQLNATNELNQNVLQNLLKLSQQVQNDSPQSAALSVAEILRWPEVLTNTHIQQEILHEACEKLLVRGLQDLNASRMREGIKLKSLILERIYKIEDLIQQAKPLMATSIKEYQAKLEQKLYENIKTFDSERVAQELVLFAQRIDIDEELTRLTAHVLEVKRILTQDQPVGKRLDFMMQELNREANTLGSKSVSVQTTQVSMELKVLIEQMREQIQNIE